ncbi:hypothetical protein M501DRAFT_1056974 [Patellaria atrata CBS 101060]|uniref:Uncharacterized protein n=1 Tax=Patellaria atrata CBS 101060 TaxID=1346257 RepID=A0A9P4SBK8_9PEZI|nr:hypothetical protein M501DRAFT_1056974 [Patellaria atrata CBS 101060]
MAGQDKHSPDPSSRHRRTPKPSFRTPKTSSSSSVISAPPKAAIAAEKATKDEPRRRYQTPTEQKPSSQSTDNSPPSADSSPNNTFHDAQSSSQSPNLHPDRLTELEKALLAAQAEQRRMSEEISQLQAHELLFRETLDSYKAELERASRSSVPQESSQPPSRRSWSQERASLQSRIQDASAELADRDMAWTRALHRERGERSRERNQLLERLHTAEREARMYEEDARAYHAQLMELKTSISSLTRVDSQVTDREIVEVLGHLHHRVREWVISNFRRSKLRTEGLTGLTGELVRSVAPGYGMGTGTPSGAKIAVLQGIVARQVVGILRDEHLFGLPREGALGQLHSLFEYLHATKSPGDFQQWRAATYTILQKDGDRTLETTAAVLVDTLVSQTERIIHDLTGADQFSKETRAQLHSIIQQVVELSRTLIQQHAQYRVIFPPSRNEKEELVFDHTGMEAFAAEETEEDEMEAVKKVYCITFPGLEKLADSGRAHLLVKAKVLCEN